MKETREKIIIQALNYFSENDYQNSSLNNIAKAIGITKGGIYHYFESKEDLFKASINYLFDTLGDIITEMVSSEREIGLKEFLHGFFSYDEIMRILNEKHKINFISEYFNYLYIVFLGFKKIPELRNRISEIYINSRKGMEAQLEYYKEKGMIRDDVDCKIFALQVFSMSEGLMLLASIDSTIDFQGTGDTIVENLFKSIT